jgi:hypothetical protein
MVAYALEGAGRLSPHPLCQNACDVEGLRPEFGVGQLEAK